MTRFTIIFVVILISLFAIELTPPGQEFIVAPWTNFIANISANVAHLFDANVMAINNTLTNSATGFAVTILAGCNGVEALIVLMAGMLAFPASAKQRVLGIVAGFFAIQVLNVLRIISLYYLGQWSPTLFEWAHLYGWQMLIMLDVLIVWLVWIRLLSRTPLGAA